MTAHIRYAIENDTCALQMKGRLTFTDGPGLDAFITWLQQQQHVSKIVVDLSSADYLDSTMLGLLAKMWNALHDRLKGRIVLASPKPDMSMLLRGVCFDRIFTIASQPDQAAVGYHLDDVEALPAEAREHAKVMLESHRALVTACEENRAAFQDIIELLEQRSKIS